MTEPTMETLARRLDRVERENRWLKRLSGLTFCLVLLFPVALFAAGSLRSDYETPYHGQALKMTSMESLNIVCESDLADSTGYYATPEGTILQSIFKKQSKRATWIVSIRANEANVMDDQGNLGRYVITKRDSSGLILVEAGRGVSVQVITIDPRNSSFVYTSQNVSLLWNRANTFTGRCD